MGISTSSTIPLPAMVIGFQPCEVDGAGLRSSREEEEGAEAAPSETDPLAIHTSCPSARRGMPPAPDLVEGSHSLGGRLGTGRSQQHGQRGHPGGAELGLCPGGLSSPSMEDSDSRLPSALPGFVLPLAASSSSPLVLLKPQL